MKHREGSGREAVEELLVVERASLIAYLRRIADPQDAEDHLQEIVLRVCRKPPGDQVIDIRAWLYGVARHVARRSTAHLPLPEVEASSIGPQEALENAQLRQALDASLDVLPPSLRHLLVEHHGRGANLATMAQEYGTNEAALASRLARARREILKRLSPELAHVLRQFGIPVPAAVETRIWCPRCGQAHINTDRFQDHRRIFLFCPACSDNGLFVMEGSITSMFRGSPGVTIARSLTQSSTIFDQWSRDGSLRCPLCGSEGETAVAGRRFGVLECRCSKCSFESSHADWEVALSHPNLRRFWRRHGRIEEVREKGRLVFTSVRTGDVRSVPLCEKTGLPRFEALTA